MSTLSRCTQLTRRGRPCRNGALAGSDPPRCARHPVTGDALQPSLTGLVVGDVGGATAPSRAAAGRARPRRRRARAGAEDAPAAQLRLPGLADADLDAQDAADHLRHELAVVRKVLRQLAALLDDPEAALSPEETRRVAALVFSGARTVAQLMAVQARQPGHGQDWLDRALEKVGHELDLEL